MAEGFGYGLFFILAPFEILFLGSFIWIPLLIWRERVCARNYGFSTGAIAKIVLALTIVAVGIGLPMKAEDKKVGPFERTNISLGELVKAKIAYGMREPQNEAVRIVLPSLNPTKAQIMEAIRNQTPFSARVYHCASGATLLFGSWGGMISVSEPQKVHTVDDSIPSSQTQK